MDERSTCKMFGRNLDGWMNNLILMFGRNYDEWMNVLKGKCLVEIR